MALEIFKLVGSVFVDTDKADKSLQKTDKKAGGLGQTFVKGAKAVGKFAVGVGTAAVALGGAIVALTESTREYRMEQGKLETAFQTAGHEAGVARGVFTELNGVLGDSGQATEAAAHLAKLCDTEEELSEWTDICTGVYATFGDSLPIENLTEAANETAKTGKITGGLADALNWAGISEEEFQKKLDACNSEAEREALIRGTLIDLYGESADAYRENNEAIIEANKAQERMNYSMAQIGAAFEPAVTAIKNMGADLLEEFVPGVTMAASALTGLIKGVPGAAKTLGNSLSSLLSQVLDKLLELVPVIVEVALELVSTFAISILNQLPSITQTFMQLLASVIDSIGAVLPDVLSALLDGLLGTLNNLLAYTPDVIAAFVSLFNSVVEALPGLLQNLMAWLPELTQVLIDAIMQSVPLLLDSLVAAVTLLVEQLPVLIPQIVDLVMNIILMLTEALPVLIPQLVDAVIAIIMLLVDQIPVIIPMLIDACILIINALIAAMPSILLALVKAMPELLVAVWDAIIMVFEGLPEWFGDIQQGVLDIIDQLIASGIEYLAGFWSSISEIFSPIIEWFSDLFSDAWAGIEAAFSVENALSFFEDLWSNIQGAFASVTSWFKDTFADAWQAVKDVFSTGGQVFDGIKEGIADVFKTTVNAIIRGINKVIAVPFNNLNAILKRVKNVEIMGFAPFSWVGTLDVPEIPELEKGAVLEKGQVGLLEGNGAEAVVPLHQNQEWISAVARDMDAAIGGTSGGKVLDVLTAIQASLEAIAEAGICLDTGALVGALAQPMDRRLGQLQAAKGRL